MRGFERESEEHAGITQARSSLASGDLFEHDHTQGDKVIPTEPTESQALAPTTGRLAMLCLVFRAGGIGAPRVAVVGRRLVPAVVLLSALVALGALLASPALAERARLFEGAFGCEAGVAGCTTPDPYPLVRPEGVAVDEKTGDIYVANETQNDVQRLKCMLLAVVSSWSSKIR